MLHTIKDYYDEMIIPYWNELKDYFGEIIEMFK
jgi:hypothetical protein